MILNGKIIEMIKEESGLLFDKAGDFPLLASLIFKKTKRNIGVTTLKRLFCYINDDRHASDYTLNTIALFVGYPNWKELTDTIRIDSEWGYNDDTVYIQAVDPGSKILVQYLNRKVCFDVQEEEGVNVLVVKSAENSSLQCGDVLHVHSIRLGAILEAENVVRGTSIGNYRTNGEIKSITIS